MTALLAGRWLAFTPENAWNYHAYSDKAAGWLLAFINWDGQHYLRLAIAGYPIPLDTSTAFFPLLPGLIVLAMLPGFTPIAAGLLVVTIASALVFILLKRLLPHDASSWWLFASFPTAFYLSVVYTEALFVAALLGLFWALRDPRRAGCALVCAAFLPLTRGQGIWLVLPLAVAWIFGRGIDRRALAAASLGYLVGVAAYLAFYAWRYGDPFAGILAQDEFVFGNSIANIFDVPRFVQFMLTPPTRFFYPTNSGLDKLMIVLSLGALIVGIRRSPDAFLAATWVCLAVLPAMMGEGGSYARHALLAWACFVVAKGPSLTAPVKWPLIAAGFAFQIWLAWNFGGNRWVG